MILVTTAGQVVAGSLAVPATVDAALTGVPEPVAEDNARALGLFARGDADYVTEGVPKLLGRPARSLEQFATGYAPAFSWKRSR